MTSDESFSNRSLITPPEFCAEVSAQNSGDNSAVAPPVPIPNTEVKRCSPDGSTATGRARVGRRQSKMPGGTPSGILLSGDAYSSREHDVLGRRRVDGQAGEGSG